MKEFFVMVGAGVATYAIWDYYQKRKAVTETVQTLPVITADQARLISNNQYHDANSWAGVVPYLPL